MAVTSGFFNSVSGDRLYNADQMSMYFEGLISQGVFENVGNRLQVTAGTGMTVNVGTGRAVVQSHWIKNDAALSLNISAADVQKNRIDAVALRYSTSDRSISIVVKEGTAVTGSATPPERTTSADVYELFLAYVSVPKATSEISQAQITDLRPSALCGWVTGIIDQVDTSDLYDQWENAYRQYFADSTAAFDRYMLLKKAEFEAWFHDLTADLRVDTTLTSYQNVVTASNAATEINIGISEFDSENDLLLAYIGGVFLVEGTDYTISGTGSAAKIVLTRALTGTNTINFIVIKSVIGNGYASVECTKAEYDAMDTHDDHTIYIVTFPNGTVKQYLGDELIGGSSDYVSVPIGTLTPDTSIQTSDGAQISDSGWSSSDYIEIDPDFRYFFLGSLVLVGYSGVQNTYNAVYDENKQFIQSFTMTNAFTTFPSTAAYIRISQVSDRFSDPYNDIVYKDV